MGSFGVYVYDERNMVAPVRYANDFDEIDDPGALDFKGRYSTLMPGQMACLRNQNGYLLLKNISPRGTNVIDLLYEARGTRHDLDN
jgi:hypothetical protein